MEDVSLQMVAADCPAKAGRLREVEAQLARQYAQWPLRKLREEALFYGVSRAGTKAQVAARIIPFHESYFRAAESAALEDADTDVGESGEVSDSEATEPDTEPPASDEEDDAQPEGPEAHAVMALPTELRPAPAQHRAPPCQSRGYRR